MSSLTPAATEERLARIRNNDIFNTLVATPRWGLNNYSNPVRSSSDLIKPSAPPTPQCGKLTKRRYGRFKVLAHLVSAITVDHSNSKWKILADLFANGLTGVDRIVLVGTANWFRLGLWLVVFATLVVTTLYFIAITVIDYCEYRTIVSVSSLTSDEHIIPAITICNMNPFRRDLLCNSDEALYAIRQGMCEESANSDEFVEHMTKFKAQSLTNETIRTFIENSKYKWDDLLISCTFNQKDCQSEWVQEVIVSFYRYGTCFCMFCNMTAVGESINFASATSGSRNPNNGLNLVLNSNRDTYLNSSESFGFLVMAHDRSRMPDLNMDAIYAPVGMSTFVGVTTKQVNLLETPYKSNCHSTWPMNEPYNIYLNANDLYSEESCRKICINYNIMRMCHCLDLYKGTDIQILLDSNSVCVGDKVRHTCREKYVQNPENLTGMCNCPKRCNEISYPSSVSIVGWHQVLRSGGVDQLESTSLSNIVVYLQSRAVNTIIESQETSPTNALSRAGGFLNMFTGTSFLLIYETFSIIIVWLYKVLSAHRRRKQNKSSIEPLKLKC